MPCNAHVTAYYRNKLRILRDEAAIRAAEYERRKRGAAMQERVSLTLFQSNCGNYPQKGRKNW